MSYAELLDLRALVERELADRDERGEADPRVADEPTDAEIEELLDVALGGDWGPQLPA